MLAVTYYIVKYLSAVRPGEGFFYSGIQFKAVY